MIASRSPYRKPIVRRSCGLMAASGWTLRPIQENTQGLTGDDNTITDSEGFFHDPSPRSEHLVLSRARVCGAARVRIAVARSKTSQGARDLIGIQWSQNDRAARRRLPGKHFNAWSKSDLWILISSVLSCYGSHPSRHLWKS